MGERRTSKNDENRLLTNAIKIHEFIFVTTRFSIQVSYQIVCLENENISKCLTGMRRCKTLEAAFPILYEERADFTNDKVYLVQEHQVLPLFENGEDSE